MIANRALSELRPEWLSAGGIRYQMGVEFDCPRHPPKEDASHRVRLWFDNPGDGESPAPASVVDGELYPRRVYRTGHSLESLTLTPSGSPDTPIDIYMHWRGYCVEGRVYDSLKFAAW